MRGRAAVSGSLLSILVVLMACRSQRAPCAPASPLPYVPLLKTIDEGTAEERYFAVLQLGRHDSTVVKARLRKLLDSDEPMTRNAAARALCDLDEVDAAATLIRNLHRDERTFVVTDASYHLSALFGLAEPYEPNLGYRHQTEQQEAWRRWFARQPFGTNFELRDAPGELELRSHVEAELEAFHATVFDSAKAEEDAIVALWQSLAKLAPSRHPDDVHVVASACAVLAECRPKSADLWNNHALAALNDGQWREAEASYRRALELAGDDAQLHNDLGILLEGLGRLAEAESHYRQATRAAPEDDVAWANLGDVLRELRRPAEALEAYREAESLANEKWTYHRLWMRRMERPPSCD